MPRQPSANNDRFFNQAPATNRKIRPEIESIASLRARAFERHMAGLSHDDLDAEIHARDYADKPLIRNDRV